MKITDSLDYCPVSSERGGGQLNCYDSMIHASSLPRFNENLTVVMIRCSFKIEITKNQSRDLIEYLFVECLLQINKC